VRRMKPAACGGRKIRGLVPPKQGKKGAVILGERAGRRPDTFGATPRAAAA